MNMNFDLIGNDPIPAPVGADEARVIFSPGVNTRTGPGTNYPTLGPAGMPPNDALLGRIVVVLQRGVPAEDGQGGEWWHVISPGGGHGYIRARTALGEMMLELMSFHHTGDPTARVNINTPSGSVRFPDVKFTGGLLPRVADGIAANLDAAIASGNAVKAAQLRQILLMNGVPESMLPAAPVVVAGYPAIGAGMVQFAQQLNGLPGNPGHAGNVRPDWYRAQHMHTNLFRRAQGLGGIARPVW